MAAKEVIVTGWENGNTLTAGTPATLNITTQYYSSALISVNTSAGTVTLSVKANPYGNNPAFSSLTNAGDDLAGQSVSTSGTAGVRGSCSAQQYQLTLSLSAGSATVTLDVNGAY